MNNEDIVSLMERYKRELLEFEKRNTAPEPAKKEAETAPVSAQKEEKAEQAAVETAQTAKAEDVGAVSAASIKKPSDTAKEIKKDKKIRHHRNLCYESSNTAVATVTPEGLIQAVGKGTCTIWVYAQNGVYAALTVTVK